MNTSAERGHMPIPGPVSVTAPGPVALDPFCHRNGMHMNGKYIGSSCAGVSMACFRWHESGPPGKWSVDFQSEGFYVEQHAVVNDFGTLVKVPS